MSRWKRIALTVVVLVLALSVPAVAAERKPARSPGAGGASRPDLHQLTAPLAALWIKGGGGMDPDGKPLPLTHSPPRAMAAGEWTRTG